jgi:hypothetical protein
LVRVEEATPAITTETAAIAETRTDLQFKKLPVNTAEPFEMMATIPGITQGAGNTPTINGSRLTQRTFQLDGTSAVQRANISQTVAENMEGIREFRVDAHSNSAEFQAPGNYQTVSRSGDNHLHGTMRYYHDNAALNARSFFDVEKPGGIDHNFGGYISGPVVLPKLYDGHNRTFFMMSYEGDVSPGSTTLRATVPTDAMRGGDFSGLATIKDPLTGQTFAGNKIPTNRLNPVALAFQQRFYPIANLGTQASAINFYQLADRSSEQHTVDMRFDHRISKNNNLYVRYARRPVGWDPARRLNALDALPAIGTSTQLRIHRTLAISDTHTFSPRMINEFHFGRLTESNQTQGNVTAQDVIKSVGLKGLDGTADTLGMPTVSITSFEPLQGYPWRLHADYTWSMTDSVTLIRGGHSFKLGIDVHNLVPSEQELYNTSSWGSFQFQGSFSGHPYADFLLGLPRSATNGPPTPPTKNYERDYFWFFQDDYKISKRLTLNLGLRYEYQVPYTVTNDLQYNFDPASGQVVVASDLSLKSISPRFNPTIPIVTAAKVGFPQGAYSFGDKNNFIPRFGFAFRPTSSGKTVLRGGYGIFINNLGVGLSESQNSGPFTPGTIQYTNSITKGVPLFQWPDAFPAIQVGPSTSAPSLSAYNPNLRNPYVQQWNLTAEHEIAQMGVRISYIGTKGTQLLFRRQINQPDPSLIAFNQNRRPYPLYGNIVYTDNGGNSIYHSMVIEASRRFSKGLSYSAGYVWANNIADVGDNNQVGDVIQNPNGRSAERGREAYTIKHRFTTNFIWELPLGRGRRLLNNMPSVAEQLLGGWEITGVSALQSGTYFTPSFTGIDTSNTNIIGGRPDRIADGNLPSDQRSIQKWFDVSAFAIPGPGKFGNSGRNVLEGPGLVNLSVGIGKTFVVHETVRVNFMMSGKNFLNHANFDLPAAVINGPFPGTITSVVNRLENSGGRTIEMRLRVTF